jgi:type IV secretory pathway VirB4 component
LNSGRLSLEDRRRHLYIAGKTGVGKTTLIQNMLAEDIAARDPQALCR